MASKPELIDALKDPARIFNMDETSVEVSFNSLKKILIYCLLSLVPPEKGFLLREIPKFFILLAVAVVNTSQLVTLCLQMVIWCLHAVFSRGLETLLRIN